MMRALTVGLGLLLSAWMANAQSVPTAERSSTVGHYDLELRPLLDARTVEGSVSITVQVPGDGASDVILNRGALEIDEVLDGGRPLAFRVDGMRLQIDVPPSNGSRERVIAIKYHGRPTSGLVFVPEREQLYTIFTTPQWMPAVDEPSARDVPPSPACSPVVERSGRRA